MLIRVIVCEKVCKDKREGYLHKSLVRMCALPCASSLPIFERLFIFTFIVKAIPSPEVDLSVAEHAARDRDYPQPAPGE